MLRINLENHSKEHDEAELSRRNFFSRLAVGTFLSIGLSSIGHAAKITVVKADKNRQLKSSVRLPKYKEIQTMHAARHTNSVSANHTIGRQHKTNTRVHDVYSGKKHTLNSASNFTDRNNNQNSKTQSIIHPIQKQPLLKPEQEPLFLANHGRFSTHRSLAFQNLHTGDKLSLTYFEKGRYLSEALDEISFLLRDFRTGDTHPIDPELLDQLHDLKQILGLNQAFDVVCGYRSPLTNAQLHAEHTGAANNSFHMHGRAIDIRVERFGLRRLHSAALAMHRGGVGYYPESNFIHLDTGTFRTWTL